MSQPWLTSELLYQMDILNTHDHVSLTGSSFSLHPNWGVKLRLQGTPCQQVVAEDQSIIEDVLIRHPVFCTIGFLRVFQQDLRLQLRTVFFTNPDELRFLSPFGQ